MNKLTKVLSVFLLAGALGASVAGVTACKGGNGGGGGEGVTHQTSHQLNYAKKDKDKHTVSCSVDGCDYTAHDEDHHWGDSECSDCHEAKPTTPTGDKLKIPAAATKLLVEGVQTETIALSTTKTSHDIAQSEIKVYFADASGKIGEAIPAANYTLRLQDPGKATITQWTGLKTHGDYVVRVNIKDCEMADGYTGNMEPEDFVASITVTISNPVTTLAVKEGATLTQVAGPNTISAGWQFEITRANGDKTDVAASNVTFTTPVDTVSAGENKTASFKTTVDGKEVTGTVTYTVTADTTKVSQSFALNFASLTDAEVAQVAAGEKVVLQDGRFEVLSMSGGSIDGDNNAYASKYFTKRLKCNGASTKTVDNSDKSAKVGAPSYIKVHAEGAGTLTIYAYNNGGAANDGNTRSVAVYSGVTFDTETNVGALLITDATMIGEAKPIPSKSGDILSVTIPAAGDYYITHDAAMTYRYVQLDQLVSNEGNEEITLGGTKVYTKLTASHTADADKEKFKGKFTIGDSFEVDAGYTFKAEAINDVTCEAYDKETVTEGLTYWLGDTNITSGYQFTEDDIGDQTITVKYGDVSTTYTITVESVIPGVTGITATVKSTVVTEVSTAGGTIALDKTDIEVALKGSNSAASVNLDTVKYRLASAEAGSETEIVAETPAALGVGDYILVVTATVSTTGEGVTSAEFTVEISFKVTQEGAAKEVSINMSDIPAATVAANATVGADGLVLSDTDTAKVTALSECKINSSTAGDYTIRLQTNGSVNKAKKSIKVELNVKATITVYYKKATADTRTLGLYDANATELQKDSVNGEKSDNSTLFSWTTTAVEAGDYLLAGSNGVNIYEIVITPVAE